MVKAEDLFSLKGRIAVITGGAGLLGVKHAEVIAEAGGIPVLADINLAKAESESTRIAKRFNVLSLGIQVDITDRNEIENIARIIKEKFGKVDILINNAARNPKVETGNTTWSRFENFSLDDWDQDLAVGLTGTFLC